MFKTFIKLSFRRVLPWIILCLVLALAFIAVTGLGIFRLISGPVSLDAVAEENLEGAYVSFDCSRSVTTFASMSSGSTTVTQYYMVSYGDGKYLALEAKSKYYDILEEASVQSQKYYLEDLDELAPLGPISGYITGLDEDLYSYFVSALESTGIYDEGEDLSERVIPLMVVADHVNWCPSVLIYIFTGLGLACLVAGVLWILCVLSGMYQKKAKKLALAGATDEELEKDFAEGRHFDNCWVGKLYTWHFAGPKTKVEKTSDIIWAFNRLDARFLGNHRYSLSIYTTDRRGDEIQTATEAERESIAAAVADMGYPFVHGYTQERAHMFAKDYPAFKALAKREAAARK